MQVANVKETNLRKGRFSTTKKKTITLVYHLKDALICIGKTLMTKYHFTATNLLLSLHLYAN